MSLLNNIRQDMLTSLKEKDSVKVEILKMSLASLKNAEIEKGDELDDTQQEQILYKEVKKLKDAFEEYTKAGREDLAQKEKKQLEILQEYLPDLMSEDEVRSFVKEKSKELGVSGPQDMGKMMGIVMKDLQGKADGGLVNNIVKEVLNEI